MGFFPNFKMGETRNSEAALETFNVLNRANFHYESSGMFKNNSTQFCKITSTSRSVHHSVGRALRLLNPQPDSSGPLNNEAFLLHQEATPEVLFQSVKFSFFLNYGLAVALRVSGGMG